MSDISANDSIIDCQGIRFEQMHSDNGKQTVICGKYTIVDNAPRGYLAIGPMGTHIGVGSMEQCINDVATIINRENKCI